MPGISPALSEDRMPATESNASNSHDRPAALERPAGSQASAPTPSESGETVVCPYCGHIQPEAPQCESCHGLFEPLSRQATQNAMGAWFIRDEDNPFLPGCSYQTLEKLIKKGRITPETVVRGPTTRQFWAFARDTPGVAHLLGACHNCHASAEADEYMCAACGAVFVAPADRHSLGLAPIRLLPGQAPASVIASAAVDVKTTAPPPAAPSTAPSTAATHSSPPSPAHITASTPRGSSSAARPTAQSKTIRRLRSQIANLRALIALLVAINVVLLVGVAALALHAASTSSPASAEAPPSNETTTPPAPAEASDQPSAPAPPAASTESPAPLSGETLNADELVMRAQLQQRFMDAIERGESNTLEDLEAAAGELKRIRDEHPEALHPGGLDDALDDLNRRIDEAHVRKFID